MSPVRPDAPLRKVTLNLYEADCAHLERQVGLGWSTYIRELVHDHLRNAVRLTPARTLGDLADET